MRFEPARSRRRLISLTPLIDVVFILLVFFMLASSFLDWRSIALNAPAGRTGSGMEGAILVRVGTSSLDLNGEPLDINQLGERVRTYLARDPEQSVVVRPEAGVALQRLVTVLDRLAESGGRNISLARD